jgi:hypothetical protein
MSDTAASTPPRSAPHPYEPIRALLQAGKNDEAIVKLCALVVMRPQDWAAKHLLFDAFFQKREWAPALALIQELNRQRPDDARLHKALVVTLSNVQRYDEAIAQAHRYIVRYGEDLTIIDALKVAHFYTGKIADAVNYGQRGLELRDAEACGLPPAGKLIEPEGPPAGRNVISFSLWGTAPFYSYGAMINLVESRTVYPTTNIIGCPVCTRWRSPTRKAVSAPATRISPPCGPRPSGLAFRGCCRPSSSAACRGGDEPTGPARNGRSDDKLHEPVGQVMADAEQACPLHHASHGPPPPLRGGGRIGSFSVLVFGSGPPITGISGLKLGGLKDSLLPFSLPKLNSGLPPSS